MNSQVSNVQQPVGQFHEEHMRVTSVPLITKGLVMFSGVPLAKDSFKQNSGRYYATVKIHPDALPVQPAIGQHWQVKGNRIIEDMETGDYVMQQHTYESPDHIACSLPESGEQLIQFISKEKDFKGIGESKARALWSALGKDFHTILQHDTAENRSRLRVLLSDDSVDSLFQGYSKYKNLAYCNWMSEQKIPASVQQRLLKHHGHGSIQAIKENPYLLIGFGMAFEDIDKLVEFDQFEITKCDHKRLSAALEIAIRKEVEKGHTYSSHKDLKPHLTKLLKDKDLVSQAFSAGHNKAQFILNHETGTYHPTAQLLMENVVAKRLQMLATQKDLFDQRSYKAFDQAASELPYELTKKQAEAVTTCLDNAASCITGGAGTGKTTVLRTALKAYLNLGFTIHAVALSGRAAMRLHESIDLPTMTIAALLRNDPIKPDLASPINLLVIDEHHQQNLSLLLQARALCKPCAATITKGRALVTLI